VLGSITIDPLYSKLRPKYNRKYKRARGQADGKGIRSQMSHLDDFSDEELASLTAPSRSISTPTTPTSSAPIPTAGRSVFEEYYEAQNVQAGEQEEGSTRGTARGTASGQAEEGAKRQSYPWDLWMDGKYHIIRRGEDFNRSRSQFQTMLHRRAEDKNMFVKTERIKDDPDALGFMFGESRGALWFAWQASAMPDADVDLS
jgi:hypothetical protein